MYHKYYSPLWRHKFWKCNHTTRTYFTVHILKRNHFTWGGQEILVLPAAQSMESKTHINLSSPSLTNEEDYLENQDRFIPETLLHNIQYLNIVDVQG